LQDRSLELKNKSEEELKIEGMCDRKRTGEGMKWRFDFFACLIKADTITVSWAGCIM